MDWVERQDLHFYATPEDFADWAKGRKELRLEFFYRWLRYRQYGVFMPWDTLRGMARQPWPGRGHLTVGGGRAAK